jgi:hypothetical protein
LIGCAFGATPNNRIRGGWDPVLGIWRCKVLGAPDEALLGPRPLLKITCRFARHLSGAATLPAGFGGRQDQAILALRTHHGLRHLERTESQSAPNRDQLAPPDPYTANGPDRHIRQETIFSLGVRATPSV